MSETTPSPAELDAAAKAVETDQAMTPTDASDLPLAERDVNEGDVTAPGLAVDTDADRG